MNIFKPARQVNESYEEYRIRRCVSNETLYEKKQGVVFYPSWVVINDKKHPYIKAKEDGK